MIKTFIIAAQTADGYIAKHSDHPAVWTSKDDKKRFIEITKRAGVMVMGLKTFKTLGWALPGRLNIVYSDLPENQTMDGVEYTSLPPKDLIKSLDERGFKEVAICGGTSIYTMFMESGLVEKLYLTIEPKIFGSGMSLFNKDLDYDLKLVNGNITENGSALLEYDVIYQIDAVI